MLTSTGVARLLAAAALALAASCQMTTEDFGGSGGSFGGSDGSFGGSGGSGGGSGTGTEAGEALARDVCIRTAEQRGKIVAGVERVQPVFAGSDTEVGADVFLQLRRNPLSVSTTVARCRFSYANGQAFVFGI